MPAIARDVIRDNNIKYGTFYDWWLNPAPSSGSYINRHERIVGDKFSISHRRSPDGKYRSGGPFFTLTFHTYIESSPVTTFRSGNQRAYSGRYYAELSTDQYDYSHMDMWGYDTNSVDSKAYAYGAQAFHALRPDKPDFGPLVSLAELGRELPSMIASFKNFNQRYYAELRRKKAQRVFLSRSGKYHLAIQFGIMPLINDVLKFIDAYNGANERAKQLLRDNGKWVRRRAHLVPKPSEAWNPTTNSVFSTPYHPRMYPGHVTQCYGGGVARTDSSSRKKLEVWAVGKSKYWLPNDMLRSPHNFKILKRRIYANLKLSPEVIYNLIPWSWFADYFTSIGSFLEVLSGGIADKIVFQYAYIMRTEIHENRSIYTQYVYTSANSTGAVTSTVRRTGTLKSRVHASLFGFGVKETDLTPFQLGILGSLGFSKL